MYFKNIYVSLHFLHCSRRFPLSPCSSSYAKLLSSSHGNNSHSPQCVCSLASQHDFTGHPLSCDQNGLSIFMQVPQFIFSAYSHSLHKIPHLDSIIIQILSATLLNSNINVYCRIFHFRILIFFKISDKCPV